MSCHYCHEYEPLRTNVTASGVWVWVCAWCDTNPPFIEPSALAVFSDRLQFTPSKVAIFTEPVESLRD
jgi:hypothetical protein